MKSKNPIVANAIKIRPSTSASTRTADHELTIEELKAAVDQHRDDVKRGMGFVARLINKAGEAHDWTKLQYLRAYYEDFQSAQKTGVWPSRWMDNIHGKQERHHLESHAHSDVTLIDVLEHIVDGVMAGKGRTGEFKADILGEGLLTRAYMNTQKLISRNVKIEKAEL